MNTIRRARRRPRVRSLNWRTFGWVLLREAFVTALTHSTNWPVNDGRWRRTIAIKGTCEIRRSMRIYLERHPERRIAP